MRIRSFRAKISLLSLLLSGLVLLVFGFFTLRVLRTVGLERVDREIRSFGESQLRNPHRPEHWAQFDYSLRFIYGEETQGQPVLEVRNNSGEMLYRTSHWPTALNGLTVPELEFDGSPPPRPPFEGPPGHPPPFPPDRITEQRTGEPDDHRTGGSIDRSPEGPGGERPGGNRPGGPSGVRPDGPDGNRPAGPMHGPGDGQRGPARHPRSLMDGQGAPPPMQPMHLKVPVFHTVRGAGESWRIGVMGNQLYTLVIGLDLAALQTETHRFAMSLLAASLIALFVLAFGGWYLAKRALKPVTTITGITEEITVRGLDRRIPSADADSEFKRLIDVINGMLIRLETSFQQAVRFSADAAHELKTPLTIVQAGLDQAVQQAESDSDEQRRYGGLLEEIQRLKSITQKLLLLSQADSGELDLHREPMALSETLKSSVEDLEILAPHLHIDSDITPGITVIADTVLLRQAIRNLCSNAMKYNREDGRIDVRLETGGGMVSVIISNTGPPIPVEDRERIFDRFYRVDQSRSKRIDGAGLGLSLAREIARAHGGDITLVDGQDGVISFVLTLPRSSQK